jgi:hypothetical protein
MRRQLYLKYDTEFDRKIICGKLLSRATLSGMIMYKTKLLQGHVICSFIFPTGNRAT